MRARARRTRICPLPLLLAAVHEALRGLVSRLTVLIALGTHSKMGAPDLARHLGYPEGALAERYPATTVRNHEWWDPDAFTSLGTSGADRVAELSDGLPRAVALRGQLNGREGTTSGRGRPRRVRGRPGLLVVPQAGEVLFLLR